MNAEPKEATPGTVDRDNQGSTLYVPSRDNILSLRKAKKVPPFPIRQETLELMNPLSRLVAERCIDASTWELVE